MPRTNVGFYEIHREWAFPNEEHPAFYNKQRNIVLYFFLLGMASFKDGKIVKKGQLITSYGELARMTYSTEDQVRYSIKQLCKHKIISKAQTQLGLRVSILWRGGVSGKVPSGKPGNSHLGNPENPNGANSFEGAFPDGTPGDSHLGNQVSPTVISNELRSNSTNDYLPPKRKNKISQSDRQTDGQTLPQDSRQYNDHNYAQSQQDISTPFDDQPGSQSVGQSVSHSIVDNINISDKVRNLLENSGIKRNEELVAISVRAKELNISDAHLSIMANEMYGKYKENKIQNSYKYFLGCIKNNHKEAKIIETPKQPPIIAKEPEKKAPDKNQEFTDYCWNDRLKEGEFPLEFDFKIDGYPSDFNENPGKYREVKEHELK